MADEGDVDLRNPLQDLVGSDPVEGGELREEGNGHLQALGHAGLLSSTSTRKRRR